MKKHLLFLAVICGAMIGTSCSSDDSPITIPDEITQFAKTKYADLAAMFEIELNKIVDEGASLTAINFTESGKAILEITKDGIVSYVTYNATVTDDGTLIITDEGGKEVGRVKNAFSRSSENVSITVDMKVTIGGKTYQFQKADPVAVQKVMKSLAGTGTTQTNNIARTWKVASMNIVIEGGVEVSMLERSGNLKPFADAAQENGAKLTPTEYQALCKTINSVTLDKNGLFSIQYTDTGTDACTWQWTDSNQKQLLLQLRKDPRFGNKYIPLGSKITADFNKTGVALTLRTDITGEKNYKVTITIVLKESV